MCVSPLTWLRKWRISRNTRTRCRNYYSWLPINRAAATKPRAQQQNKAGLWCNQTDVSYWWVPIVCVAKKLQSDSKSFGKTARAREFVSEQYSPLFHRSWKGGEVFFLALYSFLWEISAEKNGHRKKGGSWENCWRPSFFVALTFSVRCIYCFCCVWTLKHTRFNVYS